jgi:arsenite methyltransferase
MENKPLVNRLAWLSAMAAMLACYGTMALVGILALLGISIAVNPVAMAGAISAFALFAVLVILVSAKRVSHYGPSVLAIAGAGFILWAMWKNYHWLTELVGFALIVCGTWWDWRMRKEFKG